MIAEKIIIGSETPKFKKALWVDISTEIPTIKIYLNGNWVACNSGGTTPEQPSENDN